MKSIVFILVIGITNLLRPALAAQKTAPTLSTMTDAQLVVANRAAYHDYASGLAEMMPGKKSMWPAPSHLS